MPAQDLQSRLPEAQTLYHPEELSLSSNAYVPQGSQLLILLCLRYVWSLLFSLSLLAHLIKFFCEAAFFQELFSQLSQLLVKFFN
jgi:hypothetical protein